MTADDAEFIKVLLCFINAGIWATFFGVISR